jgi:hypothetical protein
VRADAENFKTSDEAFSKRFEARQQLEAYISRVEEMVSDPGTAVKLKRGQKEKIEGSLSEAMAQLEIEETTAEELKRKVIIHATVESCCMQECLLDLLGTRTQAHCHQGILYQINVRSPTHVITRITLSWLRNGVFVVGIMRVRNLSVEVVMSTCRRWSHAERCGVQQQQRAAHYG